MPTYARVDNDTVLEIRDLDVIPAHKAALWRPVVIEGSGPLEQTIVEPSQVRIVKTQIPLDQVKSALKARVAADAEACRLKYITPGSGKAMSYLEKHNQAEAVDDLGEAAANALTEAERIERFPTLAASVGIEAPTLWDCAQLIRARYEAWAEISHGIELKELSGKKAISDASDAAAAQAAYEAITWPHP